MPSFEILENPCIDIASELYSADNKLIGKYYKYNRSFVDYKNISKNVINALLATEDHDFYNHSGIYFTGLFRAFFLSIVLRYNKGGGSTLTQQLAKNLFDTRGKQYDGILSSVPVIKTLVLKTKEWIFSVLIESRYSKEEIISMYLNSVSFGNNVFGIDIASKVYFNVNQKDLNYSQASLLIGLLKAPSYFNPFRHEERAKKRRNTVLYNLYKSKFIDLDTFKKLCLLDLNLSTNKYIQYAPYFKNYILDYLLKFCKEHNYDLYSSGLKIYTTIDSRVQKYAEEAVNEHIQKIQDIFDAQNEGLNPWVDNNGQEIKDFIKKVAPYTTTYREIVEQYGSDNIEQYMNTPRKTKLFTWHGIKTVNISPYEEIAHNKKLFHSGLISIEPKTGNIKAWVGGINYDYFKYDHVRQGLRQPGSAFKPIIYVTAIDNGMDPSDMVADLPITFDDGWTPKNVNDKYSGKYMTLRQALAKSVNSVSAYLIKKYNPSLVINYARMMGIKSKLDPVPALCLGCNEVSVYELTESYCTFLNKGMCIEPIFISKIEDRYGNVIAEFVPAVHDAFSEETAKKMVYMLRGATEEIGGTFQSLDSNLKSNNEIAGKTGTSSNLSDAWCIGMIKNLCTGIWVGTDNRCIHFNDIRFGQGARVALPIFERFITKLYNDKYLKYKKASLL